ncbi:hypothetical protein IWQ57_003880 [Coemansia nantahalensis]|uniref:Uncharacterized protein n=1 Tax=Coemansia nantahalensis TaxID=2789366 RepID=A0ACC1JUL4_9FUNG|nr:hypothetical protein IWQ57_003880 [Coemansia nantahalensis]
MAARAAAAKFAGLDVETGQPDVYETPDAPGDGPADDECAPEAPLDSAISAEALPAAAAAARFRAAAGDAGHPSALARYQRSLFRALQLESLGGDLEAAAAPRLSETPEQRLRRLVYETQELKAQLAADAATEPPAQSVALMRLASDLHDDLARLASPPAAAPAPAAATAADRTTARPARTSPPADAALLERRLAALEATVGGGSGAEAAGRSVADAVARLRQQLDVLADPQRVDGIHRRIRQALVDMDRLDAAAAQAARASGDAADGARIDSGVARRIDELYDKLAGVDALVELAPATARRLQSLAQLHADASSAVARIGRLEAEQTAVGGELAAMRDVADALRSTIADNAAALHDNVGHLDSRIAAIGERLVALARS